MKESDPNFLRRALEIAARSRQNGNHPFGALLVDEHDEIVIEAENTVVTEADCTGHAETNLVRKASAKYDEAFLRKCSLYTSTEPCPMCSGAIFWSGIGRMVFGLGQARFYEVVAGEGVAVELRLPCREVFARGNREIEVVGPLLEDEATAVHEGFWS